MLASLLFPYDDDAADAIEGWLGALEKEKCITRYIRDGNHYIQITNWLLHQKIDKPSRSKIPPINPEKLLERPREEPPKPREESPKPREESPKPREESSGDQGSGSWIKE
jgi:hypothetical protein